MEFLTPVSIILNIIFVIVIALLWRGVSDLSKMYSRTLEEVRRLRKPKQNSDFAELERLMKLTIKPAAHIFDDKTKSLLNLAIKNSNENESRVAAVEACKRIHKKLNV